MADAVLQAHIDQFFELRMHRDQVHSEGLIRHGHCCGDFPIQQARRHGTAGDHAETASARQGRNQVAFRHPCHRATEDGVLGTQKSRPRCQSLSSCLCGAIMSPASTLYGV